MAARRLMNRLYYFTVEDETMLTETFAQLDKEVYAISYKVSGTEDVFVTTSETKDAMDRHDIPYNLLAEEDGARISVYHSPLSREELADYEDAIKALALAYRAIALACCGKRCIGMRWTASRKTGRGRPTSPPSSPCRPPCVASRSTASASC